MERRRIDGPISMLGVLVLIYGLLNLMGASNYKDYSSMLKGLPGYVAAGMYIFTILYGASSIYCGFKITRRDDWARSLIVFVNVISVLATFFIAKTLMANTREYFFSGAAGIEPAIAAPAYRAAVILTGVCMLFEIFLIVFFTRPAVIERFKAGEK